MAAMNDQSSERPITSVTEAVERFLALPRPGNRSLIFRGHAHYDWTLQSRIVRCIPAVRERENEIVRELVSVAPDAFQSDQTMFDRLVRMQHFGLPTRLLDTTANPLVALYFAAEELEENSDGAVLVIRSDLELRKYYDSDTVSCITNLANLSEQERLDIEDTTARTIGEFNKLQSADRLLQFIRAEKPAFRPRMRRSDLFRRLHVIPKMNNPRIVAQSGSFIVFGLTRSKGPDFKIHIVAERLRIAAGAKGDIRRELARLGLTESSLFPELDKAASNIVRRISEMGDSAAL